MDETHVIFIETPTNDDKSRSLSPVSPSNYRARSGFFDMLSRRFGRRSNDELYFSQNGDDDNRSSSTESCSSTSVQFADCNDNRMNKPCKRHMTPNCHACDFRRNCNNGSSSTSDSSIESMIDNNNLTSATANGLDVHRRSSSSLFFRTIQNLSISRSQSCGSTITTTDKGQKTKKSSKKTQPQQKCILRQPTKYTWHIGMSGLPTQRVPRSSVCCNYPMHR